MVTLHAPSPDHGPARALADGWVTHLKRWSPGASPQVLGLAHALSLAASAGQVCLRLPEQERTALQAALLESGLARMSDIEGIKPIVIDPEGRVYLARFHDLELRLARRIVRALRRPLPAPSRTRLEQIANWFGTHPDDHAHEQFAAARAALDNSLTLISGGPGTGKTTTLANLLGGLLLQSPDLRIALAAPTGKAAARMLEALSHRATHLPEDIQARLPREATTLHRLIGIAPHGGPARFDAGRPLPVDVLVIDEASMLDLAMATPVLEALPDQARIILLGDRHQLAAVEAGAVFAELTSLAPVLPKQIVSLSQSFRFASESGIGRIARAARDGQTEALMADLARADREDLRWINLNDGQGQSELMQCIQAGLSPYLEALQLALRQPLTHACLARLERALQSFRLLCAVRQGPTGTDRINAEVSAWVRQHTDAANATTRSSDWYPGRVILLTRNDPATGLFNGDLGIALPDSDGLIRVHFPHRYSSGPSTAAGEASLDAPKGLPIERLPAHDTAFAMTVHKSQGSEFDQILLVLPDARSPVLTRELLYTGITRARHHATVAASEESLRAASERVTSRDSGLAKLVLREQTGGLSCVSPPPSAGETYPAAKSPFSEDKVARGRRPGVL